MLFEEVADNEPGRNLIILDQVSNENVYNCSKNIVFFGDSIPKSINIENCNSQLYNANCRCRFFGGTTLKHFHHYLRPAINETDVITDKLHHKFRS